ncbi:hypothetical protein CASFOL_040754 [Castilleja foliolosa]|uniref:F-box domain-containing protein n=1 Tax=Castilleja foliolosa TaxID=1961234 RepID=A0ABD3BD14_9LAMI
MAIVIPWDSWHEIFVRLPAKSLLRCRAVSKAWRAFIDDGCFVKAYTKRQLTPTTSKNVIIHNSAGPPFHPFCSLNLDALNFHGSSLQTVAVTPLDSTQCDRLNFPVAACDGLMLIAPSKPEQKWQIRNPSTNESLDLPQPDSRRYAATGLGYDKSSDDYKAVVIDYHCRRPGDGESEVYVYRTQIYSLKSDSWRSIADFPGHSMWGPSGPGVYMCGSLNWVNFISRVQNYEMMIALDLGAETYRELRVPNVRYRPKEMCQNRYLDVLDSGRLIMTDHSFTYDNKLQNFDVWVMQDYEADDSWVRCYSVEGVFGVARNVYHGLRFVAFMADKLQLLLQDGWGFYLHDVQTSSVRRLVIEGLSKILSDENRIHVILSAQVMPESIFRLHDNCGVGGRKRIVVDKEESVQIMSKKE